MATAPRIPQLMARSHNHLGQFAWRTYPHAFFLPEKLKFTILGLHDEIHLG